jgi:hypothetical protein
MIKIVSIFISFLILLQSLNINLDEYAQIDELIGHVFYHAEEYGDDIFVFVSKHYGELKDDHDNNNDKENERHEQLPFNHQCSPNFISVYILETAPLAVLRIDEISVKTNFLYQEINSFFEKSNVFQPPQIAYFTFAKT